MFCVILGPMRALCTLQVPNAEIIKLILNLEYTYACAMCYVLCAMCYVLCAMCYVLCAMCYVLCAMCYVLCAMCYVPIDTP
ncbi:putative membrane protein [Anaplasma phagocytophilum str. Webster]|nr:putative membrane protein [Anaplasma phagocytophilum str. Webster]